ncbi:ergothioneine biosynthesis glutamate--cysteine ligase EgtA [Streptomyces sp. E11-3]|uniref:ergothioneine biosynthesis glutamate--cysteine ligase EgtA n=1 Tax=Streptomyces sp. E11-3 TaxID=3110112 RepID=UPI00397EC605
MTEADCTERHQRVSESEVQALVHGICFKTGPPRALGVELEWLVHELREPRLPVPPDRRAAAYAAIRALPLSSAVTVEPGGQLELSSLPAASPAECVAAARADLDRVRTELRRFGLGLTGAGQDPWHPPRRLLHEPRYDAMETYLDRTGPAGRSMMCSTASVQICVDAGFEEPGPRGYARRWRLAHLLGAVLVAAFANSPLDNGRPTGWRSTRQAVWAAIEPGRSAAPPLDEEPRSAWTRHVLDAPVMCVRSPDAPWAVPRGLSFRDWLRGGLPRPPTRADLEYHLTTLFPPVRPRGHLELRMIDAQSGDDGWVVPLAVVDALFDDPEAAEHAYRLVKPLAERASTAPDPATARTATAPHDALWLDAARHGLADPELRDAAAGCFAAALDALPRRGVPTAVRDAVGAFAERYVDRGRCPADDLLDRVHGRQP